jgi:polyisoprenoid-binding protein YceI
MTIKHLASAVLLTAVLIPAEVESQAAGQLTLLPESKVWVDGTSNRDNWTVNAAAVEGFVVLQPGNPGSVRVQQGRFQVDAGKMTGGRGAIMDRLMYGALKSDEHPTIRYELIQAEPASGGLNTKGRVTIAGVTREIDGTVQAERLPDGRVRFTGSYPLLMSDYGMTAPTAMFGALRTGDEVVVRFELLARP